MPAVHAARAAGACALGLPVQRQAVPLLVVRLVLHLRKQHPQPLFVRLRPWGAWSVHTRAGHAAGVQQGRAFASMRPSKPARCRSCLSRASSSAGLVCCARAGQRVRCKAQPRAPRRRAHPHHNGAERGGQHKARGGECDHGGARGARGRHHAAPGGRLLEEPRLAGAQARVRREQRRQRREAPHGNVSRDASRQRSAKRATRAEQRSERTMAARARCAAGRRSALCHAALAHCVPCCAAQREQCIAAPRPGGLCTAAQRLGRASAKQAHTWQAGPSRVVVRSVLCRSTPRHRAKVSSAPDARRAVRRAAVRLGAQPQRAGAGCSSCALVARSRSSAARRPLQPHARRRTSIRLAASAVLSRSAPAPGHHLRPAHHRQCPCHRPVAQQPAGHGGLGCGRLQAVHRLLENDVHRRAAPEARALHAVVRNAGPAATEARRTARASARPDTPTRALYALGVISRRRVPAAGALTRTAAPCSGLCCLQSAPPSASSSSARCDVSVQRARRVCQLLSSPTSRRARGIICGRAPAYARTARRDQRLLAPLPTACVLRRVRMHQRVLRLS